MHALAVLFLALQSVPSATAPLAPEAEPAPRLAGAAWRFADYDGDGRLDAYLLRPSEGDRLLRHLGGGEYADVTAQVGLEGLVGSRLALWRDVDGDGRADLLVGSSAGGLRLFRNVPGATFVDATSSAGLDLGGAQPFDAQWVDLDGDALPDLQLVAEDGDRLWRNRGGCAFEALAPGGLAGGLERPSALEREREATLAATLGAALGGVSGRGPLGAAAATGFCAALLLDQATGQCLVASSLPGLGQLLPLSTDFNVSPAGFVGMGTTSPADRLHVAGVVRAQGGLRFGDGTLQSSAGTKDWNALANVPAGFADGVDHDTPTQAGTGLSLAGNTLSITGGGVGANQLANDGASLSKVSGGSLSVSPLYLHVPSKALLVGATTPSDPSAEAAIDAREDSTSSPALYLRRTAEPWIGSSLVRMDVVDTAPATSRFIECMRGDDPVFQVRAGGDVLMDGRLASGGVADPLYPVHAQSSDTSDVVVGVSTGFSGGNGVRGETSTQLAAGVRGAALAGANFGFGVFGEAHASAGVGVRGDHLSSTGASSGVRGESMSSSGTGVWAVASSATGTTFGVQGRSTSPDGTGVRGWAMSTSGTTFAVRGRADSPDGFAGYFEGVAGSANYFQRALGLGTAAPLAELHVGSGSGGNADLMLKRNDATQGFNFSVNTQPQMHVTRFDGSGYNTILVLDGTTDRVGIGTASPQFLLHVDGSAGKPGGGSWSTASDARLKKNVRDLDGALERLLALRGVTFEYVDPQAIGELAGERIGVIAQEVEQVFPDWVERNGDGYRSVTFRGFEAVALEALRELRAEKDAQIAALEARLAALETRLSAAERR